MKRTLTTILAALVSACTTSGSLPPLEKVPSVDLNRFMGDWYVIANIPTFIEVGAHNAVESYKMNADGNIDISFTFKKDGFDGEKKKYTMTGIPVPGTNNAEWKVSPFWPLKFPYYTIDLAADYSWVVVATPNRGYLWVMARDWKIDQNLVKSIIDRLVQRGFKESEIKMVPQRW